MGTPIDELDTLANVDMSKEYTSRLASVDVNQFNALRRKISVNLRRSLKKSPHKKVFAIEALLRRIRATPAFEKLLDDLTLAGIWSKAKLEKTRSAKKLDENAIPKKSTRGGRPTKREVPILLLDVRDALRNATGDYNIGISQKALPPKENGKWTEGLEYFEGGSVAVARIVAECVGGPLAVDVRNHVEMARKFNKPLLRTNAKRGVSAKNRLER